MKKIILSLLFTGISSLTFGQNNTGSTTGTVSLNGGSGMALKIDTNATTVTLTLVGPSTVWLGVGFGGSSMSSVSDMFIWNSSASTDYTANGYSSPIADAIQSWTIASNTVTAGVRTVVATRPLASSGNYTFANDTSSINIIYAKGSGMALSQHGSGSTTNRGPQTLTRSVLGVEDFSLNASAIYPNPSTGIFNIQTKTGVDKINVYTQVGAFIKTVEVEKGLTNVELNLRGLQTGIYLLELQNSTDKSWKKVILK